MNASVKYQVLSKETAIFGKIKNKEKSGEEMKTIEVPVKTFSDYTSGAMGFKNKKCKRKRVAMAKGCAGEKMRSSAKCSAPVMNE